MLLSGGMMIIAPKRCATLSFMVSITHISNGWRKRSASPAV